MQRRNTGRSLHGAGHSRGARKCNAGAQAGLCTELRFNSSAKPHGSAHPIRARGLDEEPLRYLDGRDRTRIKRVVVH
jgi:hypothetical protein